MGVLITESKDYSEKAIKIYSENFGKVYKDIVPPNLFNEITILVVRLKHYIDQDYIFKFPNLRYIITPTTGLNHICKKSCLKSKIGIISLKDCKEDLKSVTSTSELTIGLMLCLVRNIVTSSNSVSSSLSWERDRYRGRQLSDLNLGIVGLGRIGLQVANIAKSLQMKITAYDPFIDDEVFISNNIDRSKNLENMLARIDVLSIHASLNNQNYHLIGRNQISKLKAGCFVINTARGELTDEKELVKALRVGDLGGIGVDVLSQEQQLEQLVLSPLIRGAKEGLNIIITPHIGGCTLESMNYTEILIADCAVKKLSLETNNHP